MKYFIIIFIIFSVINLSAQNEIVNPNIFIRVYNMQDKKINKGKLKSIYENSIEIILNKKTIIIPLDDIGKIKTKHSGGNNILKGALIGGGSFAIIGMLSGNSEGEFVSVSASDKAFLGLVGGGFLGSAIGGITTFFKKSKTYLINKDKSRLKEFNESIKIKIP